MIKILVADKLAAEGLVRLREAPGVTVEEHIGLAPDALARVVGEFDGMIIRSGVKVTTEALASPGRLRVIARAGVGVDNIDVPAATAAGILVVNTPDANTISTAEHAVALMLACLRHVARAHAHVVGGGWDRKAFVGRQAAGKTLGIVGFGRVGRAVAERALGLRMNVSAYDPFLSAETAMEGKVRIVGSLDELLPQADCLTLHAALTADNRGLIGRDQFARMKPTAILVNCARGALVDEAALAQALNDGVIAGAAIDVYANEPPTDSPLLSARNVVLTPHLGASTEEAQTAVSTDAVESMLAYLLNGTIRGAVNVAGLPAQITDRDRSYLDLTQRMGVILSPLAAEGIDKVEVVTQGGEGLTAICPTLALQAVVELMSPHIEGRLNLVNAADFAREREIAVRHGVHSARQDYYDVVSLSIERHGKSHRIEGAVFQDGRPRILAIDGYRMEMLPEGHLVLIFNDDRPGVIGLVGTVFGKRGVNIADMTLSRRARTALMVLKLDGPPPSEVLEELRGSDAILSIRIVELPIVQERSRRP